MSVFRPIVRVPTVLIPLRGVFISTGETTNRSSLALESCLARTFLPALLGVLFLLALFGVLAFGVLTPKAAAITLAADETLDESGSVGSPFLTERDGVCMLGVSNSCPSPLTPCTGLAAMSANSDSISDTILRSSWR